MARVKPISLHPLTAQQALTAFLQVKPGEGRLTARKKAKSTGTPAKGRAEGKKRSEGKRSK